MHYALRMARTDPQFNLRIPLELKEKVESAAKSSGRSATAEIIARLEASFEPHVSTSDTKQVRALIQAALTDLYENGMIELTEKAKEAKESKR